MLGSQSVVVSSDLNPTYCFFLPIVTELWHSRIGFDVLVLAVGDEAEWRATPQAQLALDAARERGATVKFVKAPAGYRTSTVAQVSRLLGFLGVDDDRYVLTSDVDMWPLDRAWLNQRSGAFTVLYANAYSSKRWPICYLGGIASTWSDIMRPESRDISEAVAKLLDSGLGRGASQDSSWNFDETTFARKLSAWSRFRDVGMVSREQVHDLAGRRIDRQDTDKPSWKPPQSIDGLIDAHVGRPGYNDYNWSRYFPILNMALEKDTCDLLNNYRSKFTRI